jgi:hypothetical protein
MQTTPRKEMGSNSEFYSLLRDGVATSTVRLLGSRLWGKLYILFSSLRCCFGHIRTQLGADQVSVSLGSALEPHCQLTCPRKTLPVEAGVLS